MCRIFMARSEQTFAVGRFLPDFAAMCAQSREYQGHGWGLALRHNGRWRIHKSLTPIWNDCLQGFGEAELLVIHARSAFRNEGIVLDNNMPFFDDRFYFIFNGELQGVRIREQGRTGAEKIFNYIKHLHHGNMETAFRRATNLIPKLTRYVRALNILMTDGEKIFANCHYGEDPDYFTLWRSSGQATEIICSQPLELGWYPLANRSTLIV